MEKRILKNENLVAEINAHGAELVRLYDRFKDREIIYDGASKYWGRHAPILFPMVGASYQGKYLYKGVEYPMSQHGFARDEDFNLVKADTDECVYELTDTPKTYKKYPFHFSLQVGHRLSGRALIVTWRVKNSDEKELLFNIGGHPAFALREGEGFLDLSVKFNGAGNLKYYFLDKESGCLAADKPYRFNTYNGMADLTEDFFADDAYVFQDGLVQDVTLYVKDEPLVRLYAPGFTHFGLWSKTGAPFVCLEPWLGRADTHGFTGELQEKEGIIKIAPGEVFERSYRIEVM